MLSERRAKVEEWTLEHDNAFRVSLKKPAPLSGSGAIAVLQAISADSTQLSKKIPPEQQDAANQFVEILPHIIDLFSSIAQVAVAPATPLTSSSAASNQWALASVDGGFDGSTLAILSNSGNDGDAEMPQATVKAKTRC